MSDLQEEIIQMNLRNLKFKKAVLFGNIESLSEVDDRLYLQLGKTEAEIMKLEKQLIQQTENIIN